MALIASHDGAHVCTHAICLKCGSVQAERKPGQDCNQRSRLGTIFSRLFAAMKPEQKSNVRCQTCQNLSDVRPACQMSLSDVRDVKVRNDVIALGIGHRASLRLSTLYMSDMHVLCDMYAKLQELQQMPCRLCD